ncbi:hypothetical protein PENANT_c037G05923 [Penicillium antarcticum]|uniref:Uncharacterized protein n=1 Tax=Penicillium antarcticum TaxID=416450 RepID=A0A1V6PTN0_9EURO|nr:hypothetical protein PENANT_c037G05923 [Penicillium antarcticum]
MAPRLSRRHREFTDLKDLADRYRHTTDEISYVQGLMLFTIRAAYLLQWIKREPSLLTASHAVGFSGGLANASVLAVAEDFDKLSRAIEEGSGSWGWLVVGIPSSDLRDALDHFQNNMGIPSSKRAKVGLTGDRWNTVIGPPSILELVFKQCPAIKSLPKDKLNIHALQHALDLSESDLDYIVGDSALVKSHVNPSFRLWGMTQPKEPWGTWGDLLRVVFVKMLSEPLDIVKVVDEFHGCLSSLHQANICNMAMEGPSSHAAYLVSTLKSSGKAVNFRNGLGNEQVESTSSGRIAIVGMSGKGPGCENLEEFWNVISNAQDQHQEIPKDRFNLEDYLKQGHVTQCQSESMARHGCFIAKPGDFDARFFHISPREALLMDPGHRMFLMNAYEALEMAGYSNGHTKATDPKKISIFFAQCNDDWRIASHDVKGCDSYTLPGTARAFGPGRLAFHFGWEGPAYSMDSACASSVSSIHFACMSLMNKDTDMAVAGAANVIGYPHTFISLSQSGVLSRTGNCKPFRDDADGYCRADFSGVIVLKRLEDAIAANDNILGVLAGSGRNQAGNATSITTSDTGTQTRLFQKVLRNANVSPEDISYVEMHGTGTPIGDPAEMGAVANVFGNRKSDAPLPLGAVKGNVGHSESAAGMASLLKCLMMLQKKAIPPQAGMPHALNPNFPPLSDINVVIPSKIDDFKEKPNMPRRILLNNFDAAGGNGCLLLEEYVSSTSNELEIDERDPRSTHLVVSSAKTQASHHANKRNLLNWLKANQSTRIQDIAYTSTARRVHWPLRYAVAASSTQDLITKLESSIARENPENLSGRKSPIVFTFTGQGSQYAGMGAELYETSFAFRDTVRLCARICNDHQFPEFIDIITDKDIDISTKSPLQVQLSLLALEIGLAAFWKSIGVLPDIVLGHSLGEYAALYVAGVLSLGDVLYLVGRRALLLLERCEIGTCSMLALNASATTVQVHLETQPHLSCAVACVNGPNATVVSGPLGEVSHLQDQFKDNNIRSKVLSVPFAFHSLQVDPILDEYNILAGVATFMQPKIPVASTLLAAVIDKEGTFSPQYLVEQTRQKVDFVGALNAVKSKLDNPVWLEVGPSHICSSFVRATISPSTSKVMSTLDATGNDWLSVAQCLSGLYQNGVDVDWLGLHAPYESSLRLQTLPTYEWDLKDYWMPYVEPSGPGQAVVANTTSGRGKTSGPISTCAQYVIEESMTPKPQIKLGAVTADAGFKAFIDGHRLRGVAVCAGAVFIEAAETAGRYLLKYLGREDADTAVLSLQEMALIRPITHKSVHAKAELQTTAVLDSASKDTVRITFNESLPAGSSQRLGGCLLKLCEAGLEAQWEKSSFFIRSRMNDIIANVKSGQGHRIQRDIYYALFADTVEYDTPFRGVKEAYVSQDFEEAAAEVVLRADPTGTKFTSSPYWTDSLSQLCGFVVNGTPARPKDITYMMASLGTYVQTGQVIPGKSYFTYSRISGKDQDHVYCDTFVFDDDRLIIESTNCVFHHVQNATLERLLGKPASASASAPAPASDGPPLKRGPHEARSVPGVPSTEKPNSAIATTAPASESGEVGQGIYQALIAAIIKTTGGELSELHDDTELAEIGVDSIMAIEIVADVKDSTDEDLLPSFVLEYPTIGHLRRTFGESVSSKSSDSSESKEASDTPDSSASVTSEEELSVPGEESLLEAKEHVAFARKDIDIPNGRSLAETPVHDDSPQPRVRISLLQGRPVPGKPRFFLIADGSGSIATYIHLPPAKVKMPIYGVDSPFLHCPSRLTPEAGIPAAAKWIVEALVKAQPEGPFFLGGFSGGAMLSYEIARQLAALGRKVDSMILIDMCCPRPTVASNLKENLWNDDIEAFEAISSHADSNVATNTQQHLRAIFKAVSIYHPPPMTVEERPERTIIIWAQKGMITRCYDNPEIMRGLAERGLTRDPPAGFMEDPAFGAIRWSILSKGANDLGPNGWQRYIGYEPLCLSVDLDHLEMMAPGQVHILRGAFEEAFKRIEA